MESNRIIMRLSGLPIDRTILLDYLRLMDD
jgi:hypothetical protein